MSLSLEIVDRIRDVPRQDWDALAAHDPEATPFTSWVFLEALEATGCTGPRRGWAPLHLLLRRDGRLVAAAPAFLKVDSSGDFSRDWGFAESALRAGLAFYPKMVLAAPFSPATGRRILVAEGEDRRACVSALVEGAVEVAREVGCSGIQVLFCTPGEAAELEAAGMAPRTLVQYHWQNRGYASPEEWLATFRSSRRNKIKRERRAPSAQGITLRTRPGAELAEDAGAAAREIYRLYLSTVDKFAWGRRYLNEPFFRRFIEGAPEAVELVEARRNGDLVAGAFNVVSKSRLYGRYWGCHEELPFLHFNVCLYHSIDRCIQTGIQVFEGGMGGEHKLQRGFDPVLTYGAHLYLDARLDDAVRRYAALETRAYEEELRRIQRRNGT